MHKAVIWLISTLALVSTISCSQKSPSIGASPDALPQAVSTSSGSASAAQSGVGSGIGPSELSSRPSASAATTPKADAPPAAPPTSSAAEASPPALAAPGPEWSETAPPRVAGYLAVFFGPCEPSPVTGWEHLKGWTASAYRCRRPLSDAEIEELVQKYFSKQRAGTRPRLLSLRSDGALFVWGIEGTLLLQAEARQDFDASTERVFREWATKVLASATEP
jgi:hypothetical protein